MTSTHDEPFVHVARIIDRGERSAVYRALASGSMQRLHPGVHIDAGLLAALGADDRYRLRVHAVRARLRGVDVISHWSAAALWGLPCVDGWPSEVHSTVPMSSLLTSTRTLRRHRTSRAMGETSHRDGLPVTTLARTVVDIAATNPFATAVAVADAALFSVARNGRAAGAARSLGVQFLAELDGLGSGPGSARARRVIEFADARADRPGESLSRATMHVLGAPAPVLQYPVVGASGRTWHTDFGWPEVGAVAEFDGRAKYTDPVYLGGRTPAEVVYEEKRREDDIRASVRAFGRWDWMTARSLPLLGSALRRIGVLPEAT